MKKAILLAIALLLVSCTGTEIDTPEYSNYNFSFIIHYDKGHSTYKDHNCGIIFHGNELLKCRTGAPYAKAAERAIEIYHIYKDKYPGKRICVEYELTEHKEDLGEREYYFPEPYGIRSKGDYACFYNRTWKHVWWEDEPNI